VPYSGSMESESAGVATPLRGQKRTRTILGFDIGGTKTAIVEATTQAEILQRHEVPTNAELPFHKVFPGLASLAEKLIAEATRAGREVKALSVSVGRLQQNVERPASIGKLFFVERAL
jgi:predicted NBD/HSP70 family sugar kinase